MVEDYINIEDLGKYIKKQKFRKKVKHTRKSIKKTYKNTKPIIKKINVLGSKLLKGLGNLNKSSSNYWEREMKNK